MLTACAYCSCNAAHCSHMWFDLGCNGVRKKRRLARWFETHIELHLADVFVCTVLFCIHRMSWNIHVFHRGAAVRTHRRGRSSTRMPARRRASPDLTNANSLRRRCALALALASVGRAAPGPKAKRHSVSSAPHRHRESCDLLRLFGCAYLPCRTSIPRGRRAQGRLHLGRGPL